MTNLFKIWFRKNHKFTEWLVTEARKRGYCDVEIDCENQIVYFRDIFDSIAVFSPLTKKDAYFIKEKADILPNAFSKTDIVYRVYKDGSMSLVKID